MPSITGLKEAFVVFILFIFFSTITCGCIQCAPLWESAIECTVKFDFWNFNNNYINPCNLKENQDPGDLHLFANPVPWGSHSNLFETVSCSVKWESNSPNRITVAIKEDHWSRRVPGPWAGHPHHLGHGFLHLWNIATRNEFPGSQPGWVGEQGKQGLSINLLPPHLAQLALSAPSWQSAGCWESFK